MKFTIGTASSSMEFAEDMKLITQTSHINFSYAP